MPQHRTAGPRLGAVAGAPRWSTLSGLFRPMALPEASASPRGRPHDMIIACSPVQPLCLWRSGPPPLRLPLPQLPASHPCSRPTPPSPRPHLPHPPPISTLPTPRIRHPSSSSLISLPTPVPSTRHMFAHPHSLALPPIHSCPPFPLPSRPVRPTESGCAPMADHHFLTMMGPPGGGCCMSPLVRVVSVW